MGKQLRWREEEGQYAGRIDELESRLEVSVDKILAYQQKVASLKEYILEAMVMMDWYS